MATRRHTLVTIATFACTAAFVLTGCGGGGSNSVAKFCKDNETLSARYASLGDTVAFDASALTKFKQFGADLDQLSSEAPDAIKPDVKWLADAMAKIVNGQGDSVDDNMIDTVSNRIEAYANAKCDGTDASNAASSSETTSTTVDITSDMTSDTTFDTTPSVDVTVPPSITMPDLRNTTVADAKAQLTSAGITSDPVIVEQKDATVAPGLVIEQDPYAGSQATGEATVTLTVSAVPDQAFLSDFRATDGSFRPGVASMKGVPYTHGVLQSQGSGYNPQKTTFTLSGHYVRLKGVVGLDDAFTGGASVQVEIFDQDNTSLFKKIVKVGQPATIDIPVNNVIQLTLEATDLLTNVANSGTVVWGDVKVVSGS